jgi:hypothetical protein
MKLKDSLLIHKSPPPVSMLCQIDHVHGDHPASRRYILILSSHLRLGLASSLLLSGLAPTRHSPVYADGDQVKDGRCAARHIHCYVEVTHEVRQAPRAVDLQQTYRYSGERTCRRRVRR